MKQLLIFVEKEFYHMLRDRKTLLILFGSPIIQILIFGFALTNEIKNSNIYITDRAQDDASRQLISKMEASRYFEIEKTETDERKMEDAFRKGKIRMAVVIPANFQHDLAHQHTAAIQVIADATDPNTASTLLNYLSSIILDYQLEQNELLSVPQRIVPEIRMLYNPHLKGAPNFVPGVMSMVLMLVSVTMTAVAIVREKENGTMEVLLVSPFRPALVILSKSIPYLVLSLLNIASILLLSVYVLDLPIKGSLLLLFAESTLFIITCLSLGIFISIRTSSQQAAMMISMMGLLLPTIMFSGFMFPIENMPKVLQWFSNIIPSKWYFFIVKSIMIKGLGLSAIWKETLILLGITVFLFAISLKFFKIRLS